MPNVLHNIGNTPLVRLNRIGKAEGVKCEICEFVGISDHWVVISHCTGKSLKFVDFQIVVQLILVLFCL